MAERLRIDRLGSGGDGIAETAAGPVHVPYALPGEVVSVELGGKRARLLAVEEASPDRVEPFCPYFGRCGGCVFQHLAAIPYAAWKREKVVLALSRQGLRPPAGPLADGHGAGRRRMVLHARRIEGEVQAGFMAAGSHDLVPIAHCPITVPALHPAPGIAARLAAVLFTSEKPIDVAITASEAGLDADLRGSGKASEGQRQRLIALAAEFDLARVSIHGDVLVERRPPAAAMGRAAPVPPPGGFLQATAAGEEALAALVLEGAGQAKRVADLFCGVGPFALRLAERAEVHAVEGDAALLAALDKAARRTDGLRRITTEQRDLFRRPLLPPEFDRFDAVVIDPPRQGAEAQIRQMIPSSLDRVIMVSCDAGTFARDAAALVSGGFSLESVAPVDQFKWSAHVEMVGTFRRERGRAGRRSPRR